MANSIWQLFDKLIYILFQNCYIGILVVSKCYFDVDIKKFEKLRHLSKNFYSGVVGQSSYVKSYNRMSIPKNSEIYF